MKGPKVCCLAIQNAIFGNMERFFLWFGQKVTKYPGWVILGCLIFAGLCSLGFILLESETDQLELWVPTDSDFYRNSKWISETFPSNVRVQQLMLVTKDDSNILTKANLMVLHNIMADVSKLRVTVNGTNVTHTDLCQKNFGCPSCLDISILFYFNSNYNDVCNGNENGIKAEIQALTDDNVLSTLNLAIADPLASQIDIATILGGLEKDSNDEITGGTALTALILHEMSDSYNREVHESWEQEFLDYAINLEENMLKGTNLKIYPFATRSFGDEIGATIGGDAQLLSFGFMIVFLYIMLMLGKFNVVEQRGWLAMIGIGSIGLGIVTSYGLAGLFGIPNGPMNSILPFLLLGIGIDDMFVIVQSFMNIKEEKEMAKVLSMRFGIAMKHAGVAITITSVTDLLAFAIGASTILPALKYFCLFAAMGIFFVFIYMATFFLAFFSLDQRRIEDDRNGCICCYKHKNWIPSECSQKSLLNIVFTKYAKLLITIYFKVIMIILTLSLVGLSAYGVSQLKAEFNFNVFLNEGTYLREYVDVNEEKFPNGGIYGEIYVAEKPNFHQDMEQILAMLNELSSLKGQSLSNNVTKFSFVPSFITFAKGELNNNYPSTAKDMTKDEFNQILLKFLRDTEGQTWKSSFKFDGQILPTTTVANIPNLTAITFPYNHMKFESSVGQVKAMNEVFDIVKKYESKIDPNKGRLFAYSGQYDNYITIEVITAELLRNIILASVCIFFVTLVLLTDILASLMVLISVIMTLIDVAGFMHFWGLTVDTVSAVLLTVAMGLAVDYGAHITHYFMTTDGADRNKRVETTLIDMGPAVLNGGFSTFLAFILLITSKSYVFKTFFKIFFLVVSCGLFHGMVFLPVILSLLGPKPHLDHPSSSVEPSPSTTASTVKAWDEKDKK